MHRAALILSAPAAALGLLLLCAPAPCRAALAGASIPPEARDIAGLVADLAGQIEDLDEEEQPEVYRLSIELAKADGGAGFYAMKEKWETINDPTIRQLFIQQYFNFRAGESRSRLQKKLLDLLDLGMRDPAPIVQVAALRGIKQISMRDFADDFRGYDAWFKSVQGKDANEVLAQNAAAFVERASKLKGAEVRKVVELFDDAGGLMMEIAEARRAAMAAGWGKVLVAWLTGDEAASQAAMRLSSNLKFRKKELQDYILPLVKGEQGATLAVRTWAIAVMGDARASWAVEDLLAVLAAAEAKPNELRAVLPPMCRALANMNDARAIPALIAAAQTEGSPAALNTVAQYGLNPLTGVKPSEDKDLAWWRNWWTTNRARYGPAFEAMEIPSRLSPEEQAARDAQAAKEREQRAAEAELKDIPAAIVSAGYDNQQRYVLVGLRPGRPEPEGGYKVLLVLPGGDGSAEFKAFSQRLYKNALGPDWVLAQLIAPKWDDQQFDQVVWPTKGLPYKAARFTTEHLADAVLADLAKRCDINPAKVYALGWSSGGPAACTLLLRKKPDVPLAGAIIAMSVFRPEHTEGLEQAKGKRVVLLHSPDDKVTPFRFAESAKEALAKSGAAVDLRTYPGGHGWQGDPFAAIKQGVEWLESGPK